MLTNISQPRLLALVLLVVWCAIAKGGDLKPKGGKIQQKARVDYLGDPLPSGAVFRLGTARFQHPGPVRSLKFLSDGKGLISRSGKADPIVWNIETGKRIDSKSVRKDEMEGYAIVSPDDRYVVAINDDGTVLRLRNKATGKELFTRKNTERWASAAFSRDVKTLLALSCDNTVTAWNISDGVEKSKQKFGFAPWPRFAEDWPAPVMSQDGSILAGVLKEDWKSNAPVRIRFWDPLTGKECRKAITLPRLWQRLRISSDGKHLIAYYWSSEIHMWDTETSKSFQIADGEAVGAGIFLHIPEKKLGVTVGWEEVYLQDLEKKKTLWVTDVASPKASGSGLKLCRVNCLTLSPDGKTVAAGTDNGHIAILDMATGKQVGGSHAHPGFFAGPIHFLPDGKQALITLGQEPILWDFASGKKVRGFGSDTREDDCAFSPNGKLLAHFQYRKRELTLCVSEVQSGRELWSRESTDHSVCFSDDSSTLALFGRRDAQFLSAETGKVVRTFDPPIKVADVKKSMFPVRTLGISGRDLSKAIVKNPGGASLELWDTVAKKKQWAWHTSRSQDLWQVHFLNGDKFILAEVWGRYGAKNHFILLDAANGKPLRSFDSTSLLAISPDGRYVAFLESSDTTSHVEVRGVASGELLLREKQVKGNRGTHGSFSADSKVFACNLDDTTIEFFEVQAKKRLGPPREHTAYIHALKFAPTGRLLAACYNDSTVIIWDADSRLP